jgi:hypothetical protein
MSREPTLRPELGSFRGETWNCLEHGPTCIPGICVVREEVESGGALEEREGGEAGGKKEAGGKEAEPGAEEGTAGRGRSRRGHTVTVKVVILIATNRSRTNERTNCLDGISH